MKLTPKFTLFAALLASFVGPEPTRASSPVIDDWYAINNTVGATPQILDGDTATPLFSGISSPTNLMAFGYFDPVRIQSGQTLSITFDLSLDLNAASKQFEVLSFGLYNSSTPKATTSLFGADRNSTTSAAGGTILGWGGIMVHKPGRFASHHLRVYQKVEGGSSNYASSAGTVSPYTQIAGTAGYSLAYTDDVARTFTLSLARVGDDLILSGSMGATSPFNATVADAFLEPDTDLFDAFGFYISQGGSPPDTTVIQSAAFRNVGVTLIPEPSSVALFAATTIGAMIWKRRRGRI